MASQSAKMALQTKDNNAGDMTHEIHINVLGLAGIIVNEENFSDVGKGKKYPSRPDKMRAVVAVSRGEDIKTVSGLSQPLAVAPDGDAEEIEGLSTESRTTTSKNSKRRIAVWSKGSGKKNVIGSKISFEANLSRPDQGDPQSSSEYTQKNFLLTAALTEFTTNERKVALPIGVATLNISVDQFANEDVRVMDLPLLCLKEARPLSRNLNGLQGFQMIAIKSKEGLASKKKKLSFKKMMGRGSESKLKLPEVPTIAERNIFSSVYSTDSTGDSVLRVQLQIVEKTPKKTYQSTQSSVEKSKVSLEGSRTFEKTEPPSLLDVEKDTVSDKPESAMNITEAATAPEDKQKSSFTSGEEEKAEVAELELDKGDSDDIIDIAVSHAAPGTTGLHRGNKYKGSTRRELSGRNRGKHESSSIVFEQQVMEEPESDDDDIIDYQMAEADDDDIIDLAVFKIFGREVRIPSCGPLVMRKTDEGPKATFFDEDINQLKDDFFFLCTSPKMVNDSVDDEAYDLSETESVPDRDVVEDSLRPTSNGSSPESPNKVIKPPTSSSGSPKGVADLEENQKNEKRELSDGKVTNSSVRRSEHVVENQADESVPIVVIPSDLDSLGELTPTTLEQESCKPDVPLPVALGGSGLCVNLNLVSDKEVVLKEKRAAEGDKVTETYFSEYEPA